ncbi:MAG: hypothetical protein F6K14_25755 [Symploca sp. SIO2C1]|nr:hypothetical protein [Symploca sp. SIO2C1]
MTSELPCSNQHTPANEQSLQELNFEIEMSQGEFKLILARCNYSALRNSMVQELQKTCSIEIREIVLTPSTKKLYSTIQEQLGDEQPTAVMVLGLESVKDIEQLLTSMNSVREEFRKHCHFPLILWLNDEISRKLTLLAPDFKSWGTLTEFAIANDDLIHFVEKTVNSVFAKVLEVGADIFLDNTAFNLGIASPQRAELESAESALHQLQNLGVSLNPELEASLEFVLGRITNGSTEQSRKHYEQSLALWQQVGRETGGRGDRGTRGQEDGEMGRWGDGGDTETPRHGNTETISNSQFPIPNSQFSIRLACVLYSLGSWWRTYAERHRAEYKSSYETAKDYFQECIKVFELSQRPDLVAKFINALGGVLQRLEQWDELEAVAQKALALNQTYADSFRQARAYGFLAEVALAKSTWCKALDFARQAIAILEIACPAFFSASSSAQNSNSERVCSYHHSWYLFSLARAQQHLGQSQESIDNLEAALKKTKPHYEPNLYIQLLEHLRDGYFSKSEYLQAFKLKQKQRSIEQQFNFSAFIGAGSLEAEQQVIHPTLPHFERQEVAQEIAASRRKNDIEQLVERIGRNDHKLTVIYGPSGVGKSSILQAGLMPTLKRKSIGSRDVLPLLQRFYTNWTQTLAQGLSEALLGLGLPILDWELEHGVSREESRQDEYQLNYTESLITKLIEQLQQNADNNLLTVLIFDQFEEFFITYSKPKQRLFFYDFLRRCLDIPNLRIVLSLREDYLHYLLECDRLVDLQVINNDILSKNILYYLGNLNKKDANSIIKRLTEYTRFPLDAALIEQLVKDLAAELGEVRPIELQLVGAQLQNDHISTLAEYQQSGSKEKLVEKYLAQVVQDCGLENDNAAELVLCLLTGKNDTRPLKTQQELLTESGLPSNQLNLVLEILEGSGLVLRVPEMPADRYQLTHDYLVNFIRKKYQDQQAGEVEQEVEQQRQRAKIAEINALNSLSQAQLLSHDQLGALLTSAKATKQALETEAPTYIKLRTMNRLEQTIHSVQERNRLEGHKAQIFGVSFSPDGQTLASASEDNTIKLWGINGKQLTTCRGHNDTVFSVSFSPNGQILASASADKTVKLWKQDGTLLRTLKGHTNRVFNISFSPDGKQIASASEDGTIKLWTIDGTYHKTLKQLGNRMYGISFSPDGQLLASTSEDNTIKLWNLRSLNCWLKVFRGHSAPVLSVNFSPDGQLLASSSADGTVKLWNRNGQELKTLQSYDFWIYRVRFSPDGQMLVFTSADGTARLCNLDGSELKTFRGHSGEVFGVSISPDGQLLASAGQDKTVRLWTLDGIGLNTSQGHSGRITGFSFSPGSQLYASAGEDKTIKLWHLNGTLLKTFSGHNTSLRSLSFSPDERVLASASVDGIIKLWDIDGALLKTFPGHRLSIRSLSFSPDAQLLASASNDRTIKVWRLDGTLLKTFHSHIAGILSIRFSPDGKLLASAGEDKTIKLWHLDGTLSKTLQGHSTKINCVRFSPDGKLLASASADKTIKLWSRDGILLKTLRGHEASVKGVNFSPDSQTIASVSADRTVKLWSREGNLLRTLKGHFFCVYNASFIANGQILTSVDEHNVIKLWNLDGTDISTTKKTLNQGQFMTNLNPDQGKDKIGHSDSSSNLQRLLVKACDWLFDYLHHNSNLSESDRHLCDGIIATATTVRTLGLARNNKRR